MARRTARDPDIEPPRMVIVEVPTPHGDGTMRIRVTSEEADALKAETKARKPSKTAARSKADAADKSDEEPTP